MKLLLSLILMCLSLYSHGQGSRPNIILIMADDVSPDLFGAYGLKGAAKTPNIDMLANEGVMFKTAYASAMCGPSRVEIMTGRYANTTGAYHNSIWLDGARKDVYTENIAFSKVLKESGYATAITGKWHAGVQMPHESVLAFDEYSLWEGLKEIKALPGSPKFTGLFENKKTTSRYWHPAYIENGKLLDTKPSDYGPRIEADFIMDFMERQVKAKKPFLAYWPTVAPHGTRKGYPTTPLRGKQGEMDKAPNAAESRARFVALNEYLDMLVGDVVTKVKDLGIADNTAIIFVSDNGTAVTAKTRGVERGPQVAHIVWGAGIKKRGATDELTDFSDIAPTLIDWANAEDKLPKDYKFDGVSLVPFLTGETDAHREWIYGYISGSQIVRTKNYLLEVVNPMLGMPKGRMYFTGDNRFGEGYQLIKGDMSGDKEHAKARKQFDDILAQYPPLTADHPYFSKKRGKKFLQDYTSKKSKAKHLHNHRDYKTYDETYIE